MSRELLNIAPTRAEVTFTMLSGIFLGSLILTNLIAGKFFVLWGQELSSGIIAYPVTFLVTDLISELFGKKKANLVVRAGFVVSVFVTIVIVIATAAPSYDQSPVDQASFERVFGLTPGIVVGSMIAYLTAQFIDIQVYAYWHQLTNGKHLWLRNNGSTVVSQMVDTAMVVTIALVIWPNIDGLETTQPIAWEVWWGIVIGQYIFKAVIALLDTPLMYLFTYSLGNWIGKEAPSTT